MFDEILDNSRMIVNKVVTGCGFTTYCLINNENTIIVSPRIWLIREKNRKFRSFYFNREFDSKGKELFNLSDLLSSLQDYINDCKNTNQPVKILVTYDSFSILVDQIESQLGVDVFNDYRIVIDESQSIIKDVILKEYNNKATLSNFLKRLFHYEKLLFISATPLVDYLSEIPEFKLYPVKYLELEWSNIEKVEQKLFDCKSPLDAFDDIHSRYLNLTDYPGGRHVFDYFYHGNNQVSYSYEAVIFLNSVSDICKIANKYVVKHGLINIDDITIVCARTRENEKKLRKIHPQLTIASRLPNEGEHHTTWTFVTRTAFEGVDFYNPSASTYVIADYNVESLQLDIASDIPQIIGRQRLKSNIFRNIINIYCKNSRLPSEEEFIKRREKKKKFSLTQISYWNSLTTQEDKDQQIELLAAAIDRRPELLYLETTSGVPRISTLLLISEKYIHDIMKNQIGMYIIPGKPSSSDYDSTIIELVNNLKELDGKDVTRHRIKLVYNWFITNGMDKVEKLLRMLYNEGYWNIAYYFNRLPLDRIRANNYQPWEIEKEIKFSDSKGNISDFVAAVFKKGECYKKSDVKWMLQEIYDKLGILKTAKATELPTYISVRDTKRNGKEVYKIL